MLDQNLVLYIQAAAGVQVYISAIPEDRTLPAVVYQRNQEVISTLHDGAQTGRSTVRLDIWAATLSEAAQIAENIGQRMRIWNTYIGQTIRQETSNVTYEPNVNLHRASISFLVFHRGE